IAASKNPICQGDAVTFTATPIRAGGYGPTTYEWLKNGSLIATGSDQFTTTNLNDNDVISLRFESTDESKCGFQYSTNTIRMEVNPLPTVNTPATSAVCDGSVATLTVNATGRGISYQWYRLGAASVPIHNGGRYAGA